MVAHDLGVMFAAFLVISNVYNAAGNRGASVLWLIAAGALLLARTLIS